MTITKQKDNPAACVVVVDSVQFVAVFETLHNDTNGHPRREVAIVWTDSNGHTNARRYIIKLNYETEQEAAQQLAERIAQSWKK